MKIDFNLARLNISDQELFQILKNKQKMKDRYLNQYHVYINDAILIQRLNDKKIKRFQKVKTIDNIPWYIKIINILGCVNDKDYISSLKNNIEKVSHSII